MKICSRCVMNDKSDSTIIFDSDGFCNYCTNQLQNKDKIYFPNVDGNRKLDKMIEQIKKDGSGKEYDCLMGISGGLDSSYLAYLGHKWGLRILAVHIDDGFDTEISKQNIKKLIEATGIRMEIIKPDKKQYNSLIKAYMKAGVPNLAIPQDNILFAFLYEMARKHKIKYFLSGGNFALECILQQGNTYNSLDVVNIKDIHRRFATEKIDKLKFISSYRKYWDMKVLKLQTLRPLNYIDYNRNDAFKELADFCDFQYYGAKHLENILTAFIQLYWLEKRYGVDKRTSHLSSMIVSGQLTRSEALLELEKPLYDEKLMEMYISIIKKELHIKDQEFLELMEAPIHMHTDYRVDRIAPIIRKIVR